MASMPRGEASEAQADAVDPILAAEEAKHYVPGTATAAAHRPRPARIQLGSESRPPGRLAGRRAGVAMSLEEAIRVEGKLGIASVAAAAAIAAAGTRTPHPPRTPRSPRTPRPAGPHVPHEPRRSLPSSPASPAVRSGDILNRRPTLEVRSPRTMAHLGLPAMLPSARLVRDALTDRDEQRGARSPSRADAPSTTFLAELWRAEGGKASPRRVAAPPPRSPRPSPRVGQPPAWMATLARALGARHAPPPPRPELGKAAPQPPPRTPPSAARAEPAAEPAADGAAEPWAAGLAADAGPPPAPVFARRHAPLRPSHADAVLRRMHEAAKEAYAAAAADELRIARRQREAAEEADQLAGRAARDAERAAAAAAKAAPRRWRRGSVALDTIARARRASADPRPPQPPDAAASAADEAPPSPRRARRELRGSGTAGAGEDEAEEAVGRYDLALSLAREAEDRATLAAAYARSREQLADAAAAAAARAMAAVRAEEEAAEAAGLPPPLFSHTRLVGLRKAPKEAEAAAKAAEAARATADERAAAAAALGSEALESHFHPTVRYALVPGPVREIHAWDVLLRAERRKAEALAKMIGGIEPIGKGRQAALRSARHFKAHAPLAPSLGTSRAEYAAALGPLPTSELYPRRVPPSPYNSPRRAAQAAECGSPRGWRGS